MNVFHNRFRVAVLRGMLAVAMAPVACVAQGVPREIDPLWASQQSYTAAAARGMADAGAAFAWSAASACANPGLLYSCRNSTAPVCRSVYAGYGRDSLFDRYVLPFGAAYIRKRDAAALHCRVLSSDVGVTEFGVAATLCKRLWGKGYPQGPLDVGMNVRYEYADWNNRDLDTVLRARAFYLSSGQKAKAGEIIYKDPRRLFSEHRAFVDFGVFKPDIATHVDCGLSIKNLIAYRWRCERSLEVAHRDTTGTVGDTSIVTELYRYGPGHEAAIGAFIRSEYAAVALGCTFKVPIPGKSLYLSFPVEIRSYGLFNKDMKEVFSFHCGGQAHFMKNIFIRAGFQRAPAMVYADTLDSTKIFLKNINNATLGASLMPPGLPCVVDCHFGHYEWGLTVSWDY